MKKYIPTDIFGREYPLKYALQCVGKGWADIIKTCYEACQYYHADIAQIKEKFGGLRFYISSGPKELYDIINKAEEDSYSICEFCGKPGKAVSIRGWWKTLCKDCEKKCMDNNK